MYPYIIRETYIDFRITDSSRLEVTSGNHLIQPSVGNRLSYLLPYQSLKSKWHSIMLLGKLFHCLVFLTMDDFFSCLYPNGLLISKYPLSNKNRRPPSSLWISSTYWKTDKVPAQLLSSRLKRPNSFYLSSNNNFFKPLIYWWVSARLLFFSVWGHRIPGMVKRRSNRIE